MRISSLGDPSIAKDDCPEVDAQRDLLGAVVLVTFASMLAFAGLAALRWPLGVSIPQVAVVWLLTMCPVWGSWLALPVGRASVTRHATASASGYMLGFAPAVMAVLAPRAAPLILTATIFVLAAVSIARRGYVLSGLANLSHATLGAAVVLALVFLALPHASRYLLPEAVTLGAAHTDALYIPIPLEPAQSGRRDGPSRRWAHDARDAQQLVAGFPQDGDRVRGALRI